MTLLLAALSLVTANLLFGLLPGVFNSWNAQAVDRLLAWAGSSERFQARYDDTIVHVDLNNTSLREIGEFYVGRAHFARVLDNLRRMNVRSQVYDFIFAAPQTEPEDAALIGSARESQSAYFGVAFSLSTARPNTGEGVDPRVGEYLGKTAWRIRSEGGIEGLREGHSPLMTFPELAEASAGLGSLTIEPDPDGIIRRIPLIVRYGDAVYPSLPLRVVCDYLSVPPDRIILKPGRSLTLQDARQPGREPRDIAVPLDSRGNYRIHFIGSWDRMKHYDFSTVYKASGDRDEMEILGEQLAGRLAVISDVSSNSRDVGPVPTDPAFPLSGILATVLNNILTESFLHELSPAGDWAIDLVLLGTVLAMALRWRPAAFSAGVVCLIIAYTALVVVCFMTGRVILPVVRPLLILLLAVSSNGAYRYFIEERDKNFLRRSFEAYFPPKVVERIMADPDSIRSAGERKELTILFSDIAGFTKRSAGMEPDRIQAFLNEYFEAMVEIVFRFEGTVDKFMGDGLMVFFGDPEPQPDHAVRAVRMAVEMQRKVRQISVAWQEQGEEPLNVRIGINSGVVVVGNMGSERRLSYTVLGAEVNLAQRLEANAPSGGIMISKRTHTLLDGAVPAVSAGRIQVKGYDDAIDVYGVPVD